MTHPGINNIEVEIKGDGLTVCIVTARFNDFLTEQLSQAAVDCLTQHGVSPDNIHHVWVPGSNEVPFAVEQMLKTYQPDVVIGLGCVIEGDTRHADLILDQVSQSLADMSHQYNCPVINGVIAAHNMEQAVERCSTKHGNKGWAATLAALEMACLTKTLKGIRD